MSGGKVSGGKVSGGKMSGGKVSHYLFLEASLEQCFTLFELLTERN